MNGPTMNSHLLRALGRFEGKLDALAAGHERLEQKLDGLDTRLRKVETRSATQGAIGGGVMGALVALGIRLVGRSLEQ